MDYEELEAKVWHLEALNKAQQGSLEQADKFHAEMVKHVKELESQVADAKLHEERLNDIINTQRETITHQSNIIRRINETLAKAKETGND